MILLLLCTFSGGKLLIFSKCALTNTCGRPKLVSKVLIACLYIVPQEVNSAIAVFVLLFTRVLRYVNFTSSETENQLRCQIDHTVRATVGGHQYTVTVSSHAVDRFFF